MDENKANRSDRATEPDLPPAPQVPEEELSPPSQVPQEDLSSAPEVPEGDLSSTPEVQSEDLSSPPEVGREDLPPPPEVPEEDLASAPEVQTRDLSPAPEVPDKEVSPPPEVPEAQTAKERTSDKRTEKETILTTEDPAPRERTTMASPSDTPITISRDEIYPRYGSLEEPQGSEGERRWAASEARRSGLMVATAIAVLALLLLGRRRRSGRR